jgi:uncharacterized RDD family membrane protein YckC
MSCEFCGALMEHGSLMCMKCGAERRDDAPARSRVPARRAAPEIEVQAMGPTCDAHPGLPVLGACPRCGKPVCFRCATGAVNDVLTCNDCIGMTEKHRPVPTGAMCAVHPATGASFICLRCGSFACAGCRSWGGAEGFCSKCEQGIGVKATRGSRFTANLVDNFFVVLLPLVAVIVGSVVIPKGSEQGIFLMLGAFLAGGVACVAQIFAQVSWGQSVGKRILGIKVVRMNGEPIELWRILVLRNLVVQLGAQLCGVLGLVDALMIFGDQQRCLHDYLADSMVIVADNK